MTGQEEEIDTETTAAATEGDEVVTDDGATGAGEGEGGQTAAKPVDDRASKGKDKALIAERRKRQEAEAESRRFAERLANLEGRIAAAQQQAKPEEKDDGQVDYSKVVDETRLVRRLSKAEQERADRELREFNAIIEKSRAEALEDYEDFEEVEQVFINLVKNDPVLQARVRRHGHPAEFGYQYAKRHLKKIGAGSERLAALEKELAELKAAKADADPPPRTKKSIAGAHGTGHKAGAERRPLPPKDAWADVYK